MQIRQIAVLFGIALSALGAGCSSNDTPPISTVPPPTGSSAGSGNSSGSPGAGGASAGAGNPGGGAAPIAGSSPTDGGAAPTAGAAGSAPTAGAGGTGSTTLSAGCNKALPGNVQKGKWTMMADTLAGAGNPAPVMVPCVADPLGKAWPACVNGMVKRGYYVYVKPNYDPSKPNRVIYSGAGCQAAKADNGATAGYSYRDVDGDAQVIEVGLTYSRNDTCYDNANPTSSDFAFFPMVQKLIEDQFCVDTTKEYWSGYSSGAWVGNQFSCAFPERFSAMVFATGNEPMKQPTCKNGPPLAGLFLHDDADEYNTAALMKPGCARLLAQNGCTTTQCDWNNATLSDSYPVPASVTGAPATLKCVSFKGCPANKPVVWCSTNLGGSADSRHYINISSWITPLFWDFLNKH